MSMWKKCVYIQKCIDSCCMVSGDYGGGPSLLLFICFYIYVKKKPHQAASENGMKSRVLLTFQM